MELRGPHCKQVSLGGRATRPGLLPTRPPPGAPWEQGQGRCWGGGRGPGSGVDSTGGGEGEGAWRREAQPRLRRPRGADGTVQGAEGDPISLTANTFLAGLEPSVRAGGEEQGPRARLSRLYPSSLGLGHRRGQETGKASPAARLPHGFQRLGRADGGALGTQRTLLLASSGPSHRRGQAQMCVCTGEAGGVRAGDWEGELAGASGGGCGRMPFAFM